MDDRVWRVSQTMQFDPQTLESLVEWCEAGEIEPGTLTLTFPHNHGLPPELIKRLARYVQVQYTGTISTY